MIDYKLGFVKPKVLNADDEYSQNDYDIVVLGSRNKVLVPETNQCITIYLPNGNCVTVRSDGKIEFWDDAAANLKETHQL